MQNSHTHRLRPVLFLITPALFGTGALIAIAVGGHLIPGLSVHRHAVEFTKTMSENNTEAALAAARAETEHLPNAYDAWQRRALAATAVAGVPDREALASLAESYRAAPFPPPPDMAWRVEYAVRYEAAMPNELTGLTLSQIRALGAMPETWERRKAWCKTFPDGTFAKAACATTPGVWRNGVQQGSQ